MRRSSLWKRQEILSKPATVVKGSMFLGCYAMWAAQMVVKELCLMLCPDRDTLLDVSARYLWVQWVSGSMIQGFRRDLDGQVETEDERGQGSQ